MAPKFKTGTSTELVARAETALAISDELRAITQRIIDNGGECDDETLTALAGWQAALEAKGEAIAHVKIRLESEMEYFKTVEEIARAHREARKSAIERLKKYVVVCMTNAGQKKLKMEGGMFTVSLNEGKPSVNIPDPAALPMDLCDIVTQVKPRTDEIKKRLEAGETITGASLEFGEPFISIRGGKKE